MKISKLNERLFGVPVQRTSEPQPQAQPTLVDDQLIRLAGESIPLTAVSGVSVVSRRRASSSTIILLLLVGAVPAMGIFDAGRGGLICLIIAIAFFTIAGWASQKLYSVRININSGRVIDIACANSTSAFAGRTEIETALAQRAQRIIRG